MPEVRTLGAPRMGFRRGELGLDALKLLSELDVEVRGVRFVFHLR